MDAALLHVILMSPSSPAQADDALRCLRRAGGRGGRDGRTLLLFCDLPEADAIKTPQDEPIVRRLQSGVMAMERRQPGRFLLLVRRRAWDDAARAYLGEGQAHSPRRVIAELLADGSTQAVFDAASFSPASLKGRFEAVLFADGRLACTPDTPVRMASCLKDAPDGRVGGIVVPYRSEPETVLGRLMRMGYAPSPIRAARRMSLARHSLVPEDGPTMYAAAALSRMLPAPDERDEKHGDAAVPAPVPPAAGEFPCPVAQNCFFVHRLPPTLPGLLADFRAHCLREGGGEALLPIVQMLLLALSAATGSAPLAALAVVLPEAPALLHLRQAPCALVRTALLPIHAAIALDALFSRALARSTRIRLRVPDSLYTSHGCALLGAMLLIAAFFSAQALVPLLAVSLLWLCAPLLLPALASPTRERIPLDADELAQLRTLAESEFYGLPPETHPSRQMLAACAGCMLGTLEPDEAARRVQALLVEIASSTAQPADPGIVPRTAIDQASVLCCAQFLRERMGDCDAAMRSLPAQLEALVSAQPPPAEEGLLPAFLRAARTEDTSPDAIDALRGAQGGDPLETLFLPLASARTAPQHALTLPLTHPHTYLRRRLLLSSPEASPASDPTDRFLCLCAAALAHPFAALLMRSPIVAPYVPVLSAVS